VPKWDLEEGQPLPDRGAPGAASESGRDRQGRGMQASPAASHRRGRPPGRHERGSWLAAPPHCRARLRSLPGGQCGSEDPRHPSAFPRGDATRGRSDACRALGPRWPCDEQDARYGWAGTAWPGRQRPRRRGGPAGSQRVSGGGPRRSRFLSAAPGGVLNPRCRERPGRSLTKRGEPTMERSCAPPRSARACTAATPPTRAKAHEAWVWVPDRPATDERRGEAVARQCPARRRQGLRSDAG
jgi:hypothetical protein